MQPHISSGIPVRKPYLHVDDARDERTLSVGEPADPLLKVLPIRRWIPMDVHSMMDYAGGLMTGSGYFLHSRRDDAACWSSIALGASVIGVSLLTDYRLSVAKVIPIRAHETIDYLWGASCIALPFALGYWKKSPRVAALHIATGAATIIASLFTDYRSYKAQRAAKKAEVKRSQADIDNVYDPGL